MQQGHGQHGGMSRQMMRRHCLMFGLNMILSTIIMYLVMFEMIRGWGEFIQNINFFYMALTMFAAVRTQALVGGKQFVRSMIPHHSGAILMCNKSSLRDPEIRDLCFKPDGILRSQEREIAQMKSILERL